MTDSSFNLLEEPWIPLAHRDGESRLVGLRECLLDPSAFRSIESTHPTRTLALYRLLLAIVHRAVGPGEVADRAQLIEAWPRQRIADYLERWAGHFDLFDGDRPFMQVPALADVGKLEQRPWTLLAFERASGNNRTLFDHTVDDDVAPIAAPQAATLLISHLQFTPGGLVRALRTSATRGPACGLLCVLAAGRTLQETLALNLLPQTRAEYSADLPAWEADPVTVPALTANSPVVPAGPAQRYTYLSRAVLMTQSGGLVTGLRYAEGVSLAEAPIADPMVALRKYQGVMRPLLIHEDRAFWRDLQAMTAESQDVPPATLTTAVLVRQELGDYSSLALIAGGLLPDQAKVVLWRLEERRVSPRLLARGEGAAARLRPALEAAEDTASALEAALWQACRNWLQGSSERSPDKRDVKALTMQLNGTARFWQALEPCFWALVDRLGGESELDAAVSAWAADVKRVTRETWAVATRQLGGSVRALAAAAKAELAFGRAMVISNKLVKE